MTASGATILAGFAALVSPGSTETIRLGVQQSVQRLFDGGGDNLVQMSQDATVIDLLD
jgi:hypothetical protein